MNIPHEISSWLHIAFTEKPDQLMELYYYDKRDKQFYSIFITDYYLADPDREADVENSPYTKEELALLCDRIDRQETGSSSILPLPRLTIEERKNMMAQFLTTYHIDKDNQLHIVIDAEDGWSDLDFNELLTTEFNEHWITFKEAYVQQKIDTFCKSQKIDLAKATLWKNEKMTSMTLKTDSDKSEASAS